MSFPRYSKYKYSGVEWLGDVPEHWHVKRLGHFFEERRTKVSDAEFEPLSVTMQGVVPRLETAAKTQDGDNRKGVMAGDFVINSRSDRKGSAGLAPTNGSVSLICIVLEPTGITGSYAHHLLRSRSFQEEFYRNGKGIVADLWSTNYSEMKNILLCLPPESEQIQVARFLDHETAKIDALIAEQQRLIELLKEKRQAVISHAVTKGLNPDVPMKDSGVEWLGEVPEHWEVSRLKYACTHIIDCPHETPVYDPEGEYLVIRTADIERGVLDPVEMYRLFEGDYDHRTRRAELLLNDIVYGREGERWGHAALVPESFKYCLGQRMMQFRASPEYNPRFLMYQLNADCVYKQGEVDTVGATSPHVNVSTIRNFELSHPPLLEQEEIGRWLDSETSGIDQLMAEAAMAERLLSERRSALISAAVTGKVDVRNWQPPTDESAFDEEVRQAGLEVMA